MHCAWCRAPNAPYIIKWDDGRLVYCCEIHKGKIDGRECSMDCIKRFDLDQVISNYDTETMNNYCSDEATLNYFRNQLNCDKFRLLEVLQGTLEAFRPLPQINQGDFRLLKGFIEYTSHQRQSLRSSSFRPNYEVYRTKGITNSELNCYMSSVVQCLNNIPILVRYLYDNSNFQQDILKELRNLILQLRNEAPDLARVTALKSAIAAKYPKFQVARSQDAMPLLSKVISEIRDADPNFVEKTFISDILSSFECRRCEKSFEVAEKLPILTLNITEATKSIRECLSSYLYQDLHHQTHLCSECPESSFRVIKNIKSAPDILICHLYRHARVGYKVEYEVMPDDIIIYAGLQYSKVAIICHRGTLYQGHFWALTAQNNSWTLCDDSCVREAWAQDIFLSDIYMVFYQKTALI